MFFFLYKLFAFDFMYFSWRIVKNQLIKHCFQNMHFFKSVITDLIVLDLDKLYLCIKSQIILIIILSSIDVEFNFHTPHVLLLLFLRILINYYHIHYVSSRKMIITIMVASRFLYYLV